MMEKYNGNEMCAETEQDKTRLLRSGRATDKHDDSGETIGSHPLATKKQYGIPLQYPYDLFRYFFPKQFFENGNHFNSRYQQRCHGARIIFLVYRIHWSDISVYDTICSSRPICSTRNMTRR